MPRLAQMEMVAEDMMEIDDGRQPDVARLQTALYRGQPDMVPLAELKVDAMVKRAVLGLAEWPQTPREAMECEIEFAVRAGYDYVRAPAHVA